MQFLKLTLPSLLGILISTTCLAADKADNQAAEVRIRRQPEIASDRILVRFRDDPAVISAAKQNLHQHNGVRVLQQYNRLNGVQILQKPSNLSLDEFLDSYRRDDSVLYAEPDYQYAPAVIPDDPSFGELWGLHNVGQNGGNIDADINAPEAWNITTGAADIVVGIIDSGIDYTHPDLIDNLWVNPGEIPNDGIDNDGNGYIDDIHGINAITGSGDPMDDNGHGTHIAGVIGARGNNDRGVVGVNWNIKIVACKFLPEVGSGSNIDAIECLNYLLDLKINHGVNLVLTNNSWGGNGFSISLRDAIAAHDAQGILFVAAAGNENANTDTEGYFPASYDLNNIISVTALDRNDNLAFFSNFGKTTVDLGAPGVSILSTLPLNNCTLCSSHSGYGYSSGTSVAAPQVAGVATLLKTQNPNRSATQIKNLLLSSGIRVQALVEKSVTGKRVRAADVNGKGALTCFDSMLEHRILPDADSFSLLRGDSVTLEFSSINCESPNTAPVTAVFEPTSEEIQLLDDGLGADQVAGDGIFSADYSPSQNGAIHFPDQSIVAVNFLSNYRDPLLTSFQPRTIDSPDRIFNFSHDGEDDFEYINIDTPFPIDFGGADRGLRFFNWGSDGYISFGDSIFSSNAPLPEQSVNNIVAPFWDDLNVEHTNDALGYMDIQGVAPDRELVIEFNNFPHQDSPTDTGTFQIVFFENSSDVLFNYIDVNFGNVTIDNGASATVGLQVHPSLAREYSFNAPNVTNNMSLLWQLEREEPDANAGLNQIVNFGDTVVLNGKDSADAQSEIASYQWQQVNGLPITLTNANQMSSSFTAPDLAGALVFSLTVTDTDGYVDKDMTTVTVNNPPTANAGDNRVVNFGDQVQLRSNSTDTDGNIVSYQWQQVTGTPVNLANASEANANFISPNKAGELSFELTVVDDHGGSDSATVSLKVNTPPTANAGQARTVARGSNVILDGTGSTDPDGTILSYRWEQVSGTPVTLTDGNHSITSFHAPQQTGVLTFELRVTDNDQANSTVASVDITIGEHPIADAGGKQIVNFGEQVTLAGQATDGDGTVEDYRWTQTAGASVSLQGTDTSAPNFTAPSQGGSLFFSLVVTDNDGLTSDASTAEVYVNFPPTITSGNRLARAGDTVSLTALVSDSDGSVANISWAQVSGQNVSLSTMTGTSTSFTAAAPGTYVFEISAVDNQGGVAHSMVSVTVNKKKKKGGGTLGGLSCLGLISLLLFNRRRMKH